MKDHFTLVVIAVTTVTALAAFTALSVIGSDGTNTLHDVLIGLVGGLLGGWQSSKTPPSA